MTFPCPLWPDSSGYRQDIRGEERLGQRVWAKGDPTDLERWIRIASPRAVEQLWRALTARATAENLGSRGGLLRSVVEGPQQQSDGVVALARGGDAAAMDAWLRLNPSGNAYEADAAVQEALRHGHAACASLVWDRADHFDPVATVRAALQAPIQDDDHHAFVLALVHALPQDTSLDDWCAMAQAACAGGWVDVLAWLQQEPHRRVALAGSQAQGLLETAALAHQDTCSQWLMAHTDVRVGQTVDTLILQGQMTEADALLQVADPLTRRTALDRHADVSAHFSGSWQQRRQDDAQLRHEHGLTKGDDLPTRERTRA